MKLTVFLSEHEEIVLYPFKTYVSIMTTDDYGDTTEVVLNKKQLEHLKNAVEQASNLLP